MKKKYEPIITVEILDPGFRVSITDAWGNFGRAEGETKQKAMTAAFAKYVESDRQLEILVMAPVLAPVL